MAETTMTDPLSGPPGDAPAGRLASGTAARMALGGLALALAVAVAIVLVFRFVAAERERDLLAWQTRLGIVAASRAAAVEDWLARQFAEVAALADNPSLPLYLAQVQAEGGADSAEAGYLRNLLAVTAARAGFDAPARGADVAADAPRVGVAGLMLFDRDGRLLVSTPHPPPSEGALRAFLASLAGSWRTADGRALLDLHRGPSGDVVMGFAMPIFGVQSDPRPASQIGWAVGVKPVADELYPLLVQPGSVEKTAEILLVRRGGEAVEYLSPLRDAAPLERRLALDTPELAAAFALAHPGSFAGKRAYSGEEVLATSARIAGTPWTLVHEIAAAEALGPIDARLQRLMIIFLLALALAATAIVAVWHKGASRRAADAASRFQALAQRYAEQRNVLALFTDNQPSANAIVDANGVYRFANGEAARRARMAKEDVVGKTLRSVLGPDVARRYEDLNRSVLERRLPVTALHRFEDGHGARFVQSKHVPMPVGGDLVDAVLLVEDDITELMREREGRERTFTQVIDTLVAVVDRRDPYAAHHSERVALVAEALAEEMDLGDVLTETARFAGKLLNLGKIYIPVDLLTKAGRLSDAEVRQVRDSILTGAELVSAIEFAGPVAETLRQCQERWDGAGAPQGLAGERILVTARVVAVANAFVAMVSPRAHRSRVDVDEAIEALLAEVGKAYDRRVVAALVNFLDNKSGRAAWQEFLAETGGGAGGKRGK